MNDNYNKRQRKSRESSINDEEDECDNNSHQKKFPISCFIKKLYSSNTTHLILDFTLLFDSDENGTNNTKPNLDLNKKCLLVLAALNQTKIIRYEWLQHSLNKSAWVDETKYMLESYVGPDLSEYDEQEFDIRLIRMLRYLKNHKMSHIFQAYKNVYIIEHGENLTESEMQLDESEQENSSSQISQCSFSFFKEKNTTYDHLVNIMTKCGGHLTSRPQQAELIIAVDRTQDFEDMQKYRKEIKHEMVYFKQKAEELSRLIRKKEGVSIVSSDWILDCLLENDILDPIIYELKKILPHVELE